VWCPEGRYVAYVAEKFSQDKESLATRMYSTTKDDTLDSTYDHKFDLGEAYDGRVASDIFVCNVEMIRKGSMKNVIEKVSMSNRGNFVGDPQLFYNSESELCVCYTAWKDEPKTFGLVYCPIRMSSVMICTRNAFEKWSESKSLSSSFKVAHTPRVSPHGDQVVYFASSQVPKTHNTVFELVLCDIKTMCSRVVVKQVSDTLTPSPSDDISMKEEFAGFYGCDVPKRVWLDRDHVVYTVNVRSKNRLCRVSLQDDTIEILYSESNKLTNHVLLCVSKSHQKILFMESSITSRPRLMCLDSKNKIMCLFEYDMKREQYCIPLSSEKKSFNTSNLEIRQLSYDKNRSFESILTFPVQHVEEKKKKKFPLIVQPHGGPHSVTTLSYRSDLAFLSKVGYATLCVNYRGSIGFGLKPLESLPGHIGTQDLSDVIAAVNDVIKNCSDRIDIDRVFYAGGSHGGFLGLHFALSCSEICKAVALRNPVTNVASMWGTSDIADWTLVEALGMSVDPRCAVPSGDNMKKMWNCSPISRPLPKHVPPHLFLLGQNDRRVPVSQGIHMAERLKQAGVDVRVLMYPKDNHPLSRVETQMDRWITTLALFERVSCMDSKK